MPPDPLCDRHWLLGDDRLDGTILRGVLAAKSRAGSLSGVGRCMQPPEHALPFVEFGRVAQTVHDVSVLFGIDHGEKGGNLGDAEEHNS